MKQSRNMRRRDFFSEIAEASMDVLGSNPFHGTLNDALYTFVPCAFKDNPTLLVMDGLRLRDTVYNEHFNLIYMDRWPNDTSVVFWRKLLLRHDLMDELYVLCKTMPQTPPSFMKKVVCLDQMSFERHKRIASTLPTLLFIDQENIQSPAPDMTKFARGSDIYVGSQNSLNISNSPASLRMLDFLK